MFNVPCAMCHLNYLERGTLNIEHGKSILFIF